MLRRRSSIYEFSYFFDEIHDFVELYRAAAKSCIDAARLPARLPERRCFAMREIPSGACTRCEVKTDFEAEQDLYDGFKCWCKKVPGGESRNLVWPGGLLLL